MEERKLTADEGKVLTNGTDYGKVIYLGVYDSTDNWSQITEAEAEERMEATYPSDDADMATEEDYQAALRQMGVQV